MANLERQDGEGYSDDRSFARDVRLVFQNAIDYNEKLSHDNDNESVNSFAGVETAAHLMRDSIRAQEQAAAAANADVELQRWRRQGICPSPGARSHNTMSDFGV